MAHLTNTGVPNGKLGMWLMLGSDAMTFIGLFGAYIVLRVTHADTWPDAKDLASMHLVTINTFILICSSVTMVVSLSSLQKGDMERCSLYLLFTMLLGLVFVILQAVEWAELILHGVYAQNTLFGATFYLLTGFHGLHVLAGVIYMTYLWVITAMSGGDGRGVLNADNTLILEYVGLYWHFVDLVWIILFTVIYLT
jgi:heme/copper-type cytochrome/quinol oxidase subunit 3